MHDKRKRELSVTGEGDTENKYVKLTVEHDTQLAELFKKVSSAKSDDRVNGAKAIVKLVSEDVSRDAREKQTRIITRLIRGLCGNRAPLRSGYFMTLCEVLPVIYFNGKSKGETDEGCSTELSNLDNLIDFILKVTERIPGISGSQAREIRAGRLYALVAVIESGILLREEEAKGKEIMQRCCSLISEIGKKTAWLREDCGLTFMKYVNKLLSEKGINAILATQYAQMVIDSMHEAGLLRSPEGVAIWLSCSQWENWRIKLPDGVWVDNDPLSEAERDNLKRIMREDYSREQRQSGESTQQFKAGVAKGRVHFGWGVLLKFIIENNISVQYTKNGARRKQLRKYWNDLVDHNLFESSVSTGKRFWGLQLIRKVMEWCPVWSIRVILSERLVLCIIRHRTSKDCLLYDAATMALEAICKRVVRDPEVGVEVMKRILDGGNSKDEDYQGFDDFDQRTKFNLISRTVSALSAEKLGPICKLLIKRVEYFDKDKSGYSMMAMDNLVCLVRARLKDDDIVKLSKLAKWMKLTLKCLVRNGYFRRAKEELRVGKEEKYREAVRQRLLTTLMVILSREKGNLGKEEVLTLSVECILKSMKEMLTGKGNDGEWILGIRMEDKMMKDIERVIDKCIKRRREMRKGRPGEERMREWKSMELVCTGIILEAMEGGVEGICMIGEVEEMIDRQEEYEFERVIEMVLWFLGRGGRFYGLLGKKVFNLVKDKVTDRTIDRLLEILRVPETREGYAKLFGGEDEDEEGDTNESSEDCSVDGNGGREEVTEEGQKGEVNEEGDREDGSEEDLDDAAMFGMEGKLSGVIKGKVWRMEDGEVGLRELRRQKSGEKRINLGERVCRYKRQILTLVNELLGGKEGGIERVIKATNLKIIMELVELILETHKEMFAKRCLNSLSVGLERGKKWLSVTEGRREGEGIGVEEGDKMEYDMERVWEMLEKIHKYVMQCRSRTQVYACSRASLFLGRILMAMEGRKMDGDTGESFEKIARLYAETLIGWKKGHGGGGGGFVSVFFKDFIGWSMNATKGKSLR